MSGERHLAILGPEAAGEVMVLQIAASVSQAQAHNTLWLPAFSQTATELAEELSQPHVTGFGWRNDAGRLLACVRMWIQDGHTAYVARLMVAPDQQGQGLGSSLLLAAEERMPPEVTRFELFTGEHSPDNVRLYERLGYRKMREEPSGNGYALIYLGKERAI